MKDYDNSHSGREELIEELKNPTSLISFVGCFIFAILMVFFFFVMSYILIDAVFDLLLMFTNL